MTIRTADAGDKTSPPVEALIASLTARRSQPRALWEHDGPGCPTADAWDYATDRDQEDAGDCTWGTTGHAWWHRMAVEG